MVGFITVQLQLVEDSVHMQTSHLPLRYNIHIYSIYMYAVHLCGYRPYYIIAQFLFKHVEGVKKVMIVDFDAHQVYKPFTLTQTRLFNFRES